MVTRRPCALHSWDPTPGAGDACVWCGLPRGAHAEGECRSCVGTGWRPAAGDLHLPEADRTRLPCPDCGGVQLEVRLPGDHTPMLLPAMGSGRVARGGGAGW